MKHIEALIDDGGEHYDGLPPGVDASLLQQTTTTLSPCSLAKTENR